MDRLFALFAVYILFTVQGAPVPNEEQLIHNIETAAISKIQADQDTTQNLKDRQKEEGDVTLAARKVDSEIQAMRSGHEMELSLYSMKKDEEKTIKDANTIEQLDKAKEIESTDEDAEAHSDRIQKTAQDLDNLLGDRISEEKKIKNKMDAVLADKKRDHQTKLGEENSDAPTFSDPGPDASFRYRVRVVSKDANKQVSQAAHEQQKAANDEAQTEQSLKEQEDKDAEVLTKLKASKALLDKDVKVTTDTDLEADIMKKAKHEEGLQSKEDSDASTKSLGESKRILKEHINTNRKYKQFYDIRGTDPKSLGESSGLAHGLPIWELGLHSNDNDPRAAWKPPIAKNEKLGESGPDALEAAEQAAEQAADKQDEQATANDTSDAGSEQEAMAQDENVNDTSEGPSSLQAAEQAAEQAVDKAEHNTATDSSDAVAIKKDAAKLIENQDAAIKEIKRQDKLIEAASDAASVSL